MQVLLASVPSANFSNSKTPIGPYQMTVLVVSYAGRVHLTGPNSKFKFEFKKMKKSQKILKNTSSCDESNGVKKI